MQVPAYEGEQEGGGGGGRRGGGGGEDVEEEGDSLKWFAWYKKNLKRRRKWKKLQ